MATVPIALPQVTSTEQALASRAPPLGRVYPPHAPKSIRYGDQDRASGEAATVRPASPPS